MPWDSAAVFVREVSCLTIPSTTNKMLAMEDTWQDSSSNDTIDTSYEVDRLLGFSPPASNFKTLPTFAENKEAQEEVHIQIQCRHRIYLFGQLISS